MKKYLIGMLFTIVYGTVLSEGINLMKSNITFTQIKSLNGNEWRIAIDSNNVGRQNAWFETPPNSISKQTLVPWVIQDIYHDYHGVAWYWREFETPDNLPFRGKYLLKFHAVDYLADIWVNGKYLGGHEGNQSSFELDVTEILRSEGKNLVVVRVLNPTYEPIDGIALKETPSSLKNYPFSSNAVYNSGGIIGDVELLMVPAVRISDVYVVPDWETGKVKVQATVLNTHQKDVSSIISFKVTEARTGALITLENFRQKIDFGSNILESVIQIPNHRLWSIDDPMLYCITTSVQVDTSIDENSIRFGFRHFHFENGYFRLNGNRIFLKGSNFSTHYPVGYTVPLNEEMLRRDVINMKALGYNFVRIPFGCPNPKVLDIYDELGIMVHQEHYGSWQMGEFKEYESLKLPGWENLMLTRFENSIRDVIFRDRNHPSIVMWGLLNEMSDGVIFRKAVDLLPELRLIDPSRLFILNSGRFDGINSVGSMSSPHSMIWDIKESEIKDWHPYVWMPYSRETLDYLSGTSNSSGQKVFITETGLCHPIDLPSELGDFQLLGKGSSADAQYFKRQYEKFLVDWEKFHLNECWARPEDYIKDAYKTAASLRIMAETAIRSNPYLIAYIPTNSVADYSMGESVATNFRRLKPELIEPILLANSSVRWCLRTEPQSLYKGNRVRLSVSFSNLDILSAGNYPASIQVIDPNMQTVYYKKMSVNIDEINKEKNSPFAQSILEEDIMIDGPAGKYQLLATLEGRTATGGKTDFYVTDKNNFPKKTQEVAIIGTNVFLNDWLKEHNIKVIPFNEKNKTKRQIILVVEETADSTTMINLASQMVRGSTIIFLTPATFSKGENTTYWLPLKNKGAIKPMDAVAGYYRSDRWAKKHPVFYGLHSGGMLDYKFFRNIISLNALSQEYSIRGKGPHTFDEAVTPLDYPLETICGATRISHTYCSGVHMGVWNFGQGKFIVNTLHVIENLGKDPAADKLFCNLLNYASENMNEPMGKLPNDYEQILKEIRYK